MTIVGTTARTATATAQPCVAPGGSGPTGEDRNVAVDAVRSLARTARVLERAAGDLGLGQYRVLSAIAAGEDRAARVAERIWLGRPAVSAAVDALCRDGLLDRTEAAGDQRATVLGVTPAGREVLARVESDMVAVVADLCDRSSRAGGGADRTGRSTARTLAALAALGPAIDDLIAERRAERRAARR